MLQSRLKEFVFQRTTFETRYYLKSRLYGYLRQVPCKCLPHFRQIQLSPFNPIKRPEKKKFMNISNSKRPVKVLTRPVLQTLLELKCLVLMTPRVSLIPQIKTNEASSTGPSFRIYNNQFLQQNVTFPPFFRKTDKRFK